MVNKSLQQSVPSNLYVFEELVTSTNIDGETVKHSAPIKSAQYVQLSSTQYGLTNRQAIDSFEVARRNRWFNEGSDTIPTDPKGGQCMFFNTKKLKSMTSDWDKHLTCDGFSWNDWNDSPS